MKHIHPISEESCREHYGKPVLVILKDGGELVGVLTKLENGKIILNGEDTAVTNRVKSAKGRNPKNKKLKNKAKVSFTPTPFTPFPVTPFGGPLILDLSLIALLFAFI